MRWLPIALAASLLACSSPKPAADEAVAEARGVKVPAPATPATPVTAAKKDPTAQADAIEKDVRALFSRWLESQNSGDFDAYRELFAADFRGVLRVGARETKMDRDAWLRSRQRMFERPMEVTASSVAIATSESGSTILFTQRFASGTFEDEGTKQITVAKREGALVIVSEAMLDSSAIATRYRPAGRGDATPPARLTKKIAKAAATHIKAANPDRTLQGPLKFEWGRNYGASARKLLALQYRTFSPDAGAGGDVVFALVDHKGRISVAHNTWMGMSGRPFEMHALPDRDLDGDGAVEVAVVITTDHVHGGWSTVALFTTKLPQLISDEHYYYWAEVRASGHDWRYACTKMIGGHLALMIYARTQEWDEDQKESSKLSVKLLGERPADAVKSPLLAVEVASNKHRKSLLPLWRKAVGTSTARPFAWPADGKKLREIARCPGEGAPVVVHRSVISKPTAPRFRLLRDVTWDQAAAKKTATALRGAVVVQLK